MNKFASECKAYLQAALNTITEKVFLLSYLFLMLFLVMGMVFFIIVENTPLADALLYSVMLVTTVGHTNFTPDTAAGKWFTIIYTIAGSIFFLGLVAWIASSFMKAVKKQ